MENIVMKCGHTAISKKADGKPICIICDCEEVMNELPSLDKRKAKCSYCKSATDSDWRLPFFKHCPGEDYDEYYCGCRGWE